MLIKIFALIFFLTFASFTDAAPSKLSIYALRYGSDSTYPKNLIFADSKETAGAPFAWLAYLVVMGDKKILIDTGFDDPEFQRRYGISHIYPINGLLAQLAIRPEDITDVILTHGHVDHAGNIGMFPNARLHIQEKEFAAMQYIPLLKQALVGLNPKHITLFKNTLHINHHMKVSRIGGHTPGSSMIEIKMKRNILFTGDNCYLLENCRQHYPVGDVKEAKANQQFIAIYGDYPGLLLTHHDPHIIQQSTPVAENVFLIYRE